jgi:hypothetical protein
MHVNIGSTADKMSSEFARDNAEHLNHTQWFTKIAKNYGEVNK